MGSLALPIRSLFLLLLLLLFLGWIFTSLTPPAQHLNTSFNGHSSSPRLKVFVSDLPRDLNLGLLDEYWSQSWLNEPDPISPLKSRDFPPYPENPLIKQYSAEYWLLRDLLKPPQGQDGGRFSVATRVEDLAEADVVLVPFFATLSAEMQLQTEHGKFRHAMEDNRDYIRQRRVVDMVRNSSAWRKSGGRDHVFMLTDKRRILPESGSWDHVLVFTDPVAMWHVRPEISPAILLLVDFGGWYKEDAKEKPEATVGSVIHHTQVSLLKDVIVPYTHLLPLLHISDDKQRNMLLYFKGARHRHRTGLVREKLWAILDGEQGVLLEEGFPNSTGQLQALKGMRNSEFCLHPAGDTPTSCRLFDAIASLCIPVIVSDTVELPFEGMLDYMSFSVFASVHDALQPKWLVERLRGISLHERNSMREKMAQVQSRFEYDMRYYTGPNANSAQDGAVNNIWMKILHKVPAIKEASTRERRKPEGTDIPSRCNCF